MADQNNKNVDALAQEITLKSRGQGKLRQFILWMGALIIGAILGWQHIPVLNDLFNFIAAVFTHLFQFIAIPTVSLAVPHCPCWVLRRIQAVSLVMLSPIHC